MGFPDHCPPNPIRMPSIFTQEIHQFWRMHGFGAPGGPGRARPARRASLAGWPCLAGRWAAWLARSGRQEEQRRPLAPITAGGLCGIQNKPPPVIGVRGWGWGLGVGWWGGWVGGGGPPGGHRGVPGPATPVNQTFPSFRARLTPSEL